MCVPATIVMARGGEGMERADWTNRLTLPGFSDTLCGERKMVMRVDADGARHPQNAGLANLTAGM